MESPPMKRHYRPPRADANTFETQQAFLDSLQPVPVDTVEGGSRKCPHCWKRYGEPDPGLDNAEQPVRLRCNHVFGEKCMKSLFSLPEVVRVALVPFSFEPGTKGADLGSRLSAYVDQCGVEKGALLIGGKREKDFLRLLEELNDPVRGCEILGREWSSLIQRAIYPRPKLLDVHFLENAMIFDVATPNHHSHYTPGLLASAAFDWSPTLPSSPFYSTNPNTESAMATMGTSDTASSSDTDSIEVKTTTKSPVVQDTASNPSKDAPSPTSMELLFEEAALIHNIPQFQHFLDGLYESHASLVEMQQKLAQIKSKLPSPPLPSPPPPLPWPQEPVSPFFKSEKLNCESTQNFDGAKLAPNLHGEPLGTQSKQGKHEEKENNPIPNTWKHAMPQQSNLDKLVAIQSTFKKKQEELQAAKQILKKPVAEKQSVEKYHPGLCEKHKQELMKHGEAARVHAAIIQEEREARMKAQITMIARALTKVYEEYEQYQYNAAIAAGQPPPVKRLKLASSGPRTVSHNLHSPTHWIPQNIVNVSISIHNNQFDATEYEVPTPYIWFPDEVDSEDGVESSGSEDEGNQSLDLTEKMFILSRTGCPKCCNTDGNDDKVGVLNPFDSIPESLSWKNTKNTPDGCPICRRVLFHKDPNRSGEDCKYNS